MKVEGGPVLAVLGAINVDLVVSGASLPLAGQTVTGRGVRPASGRQGREPGGGGRASAPDATARSWMLGAVGDDPLGVAALEALHRDGVGTDHVLVATEAATGVALIAVGPDGENQISVAPGANGALRPAHVLGALERLRPRVLLASLEVPQDTVRAALAWAHDHGAIAVLNPAPPTRGREIWWRSPSYVTPNEHERELARRHPLRRGRDRDPGRGGRSDRPRGSARGIPAPSVDVADTTGAGDCFNGVLAIRLAEGHTIDEAVADAVVAASASVAVAGAREGMPTSVEIEAARGRA